MAEIYRDYLEHVADANEFLSLQFSPGSVPIRQRWRNNGVSANFVGDYMSTFLPVNEQEMEEKIRSKIKSAVSFIANEMLENSMKYNDSSLGSPVLMSLYLYADHLIFLVSNSITQLQKDNLIAFIEKLEQGSVDELFFKQLEASALDPENSCMGILTIMNDYQAKVGWKLEESPQHSGHRVSTLVQIDFGAI